MGIDLTFDERRPTELKGHSPQEMFMAFNTGEQFAVPYAEIRFACPCAVCVDERTGERVLKRDSIPTDIKPLGVNPVGRYAVSIQWSDNHNTGIFHFDRLYHVATVVGKRI